MKEHFIEHILRERIPCYFISPHLDDAIFSAGGLLQRLAKGTECTVITVFTGSSKPYTLSARAFMKHCGVPEADRLYSLRRAEDIRAVDAIGAQAIHLSYEDAIFRKKMRQGFFSRLVPEFGHRYPTYRFHITSGVLADEDRAYMDQIAAELKKTIDTSKPYIIFSPLGIGAHVDHIIVRDICVNHFDNVIFWNDIPYSAKHSADETFITERGLVSSSIDFDHAEKDRIMKLYTSQYAIVCRDSRTSELPEVYTMREEGSMKTTVSIGIPAYNEALNIRKLILALLSQRMERIEIKELLIVDDHSTDTTVAEISSIIDPRIRLIKHEKRGGITIGQNQIVAEATGDILVLLDADILPQDEHFLEELCRPLIEDEAIGLVGAQVIAAPAKNFLEKVLATSNELKTEIYTRINNGHTIYLCHGRARAFSKQLYSMIRWPNAFAEDQYCYLFARRHGFNFAYAPQAAVIFRSPSVLSDHFKQSLRFINGHRRMLREFNDPTAPREYRIPLNASTPVVFRFLASKPITTIWYLGIMVITRVASVFVSLDNTSSFEPASSSKKI